MALAFGELPVMRGFDSWKQVREHVNAGLPTYYQAPLDSYPRRVTAYARTNGTIRVFPPTKDCDPFSANRDHLPRFRRIVEE